MTRVHARNLVSWARDKPRTIVMSADLTSSVECELFRDAYPDRFFSMGIAEQNMLSFAGGMAREGYIPLVHTFGVFLYRRAYDQIAISVAYPNLPVKMFGFLPGVMTPGGATHQALEDVTLMRALPNMTVLECGDATEVESVLDLAHSIPGPVYVRMLRGEIPRLFPKETPMQLDRPRVLSTGDDLVVISSGICTEEAIRACSALSRDGLSISHVHVSTLKPCSCHEILDLIGKARFGVITAENHTIIGGLGSIVAEHMAEAGLARKLIRVGIPDTFLHGASRAYLMKEHGLDARGIIRAAERLTGRTIDISDEELTLPLPDTHLSDTKSRPEDL